MSTSTSGSIRPPTLWSALGECRVLLDALRSAPRLALRAGRQAQAPPVLVIPGFLTADLSTMVLRRRLRREGFAAYAWELGVNRGPRDATLRQLARRIRALSAQHQQPVDLVGWSMGGLLARIAAARTRGTSGRVITLGAPLSADPDCSRLGSLMSRACGALGQRRVRRMLRESSTVAVTSIYSRNDGVVAWEASAQAPGELSTIEVDSSHLGMVMKPEVLDLVVAQLRDPGTRRTGVRV